MHNKINLCILLPSQCILISHPTTALFSLPYHQTLMFLVITVLRNNITHVGKITKFFINNFTMNKLHKEPKHKYCKTSYNKISFYIFFNSVSANLSIS